jgi:hypothetical protein
VSLLVIAMPYLERRAYATRRWQSSEIEPLCASMPVTVQEHTKTVGYAADVVAMRFGHLDACCGIPTSVRDPAGKRLSGS